MQVVEFRMNFVLFTIAAAIFPKLDTMGIGAHGFELIDYFPSFWIHFGPNSTTFLVAGEIYPAPIQVTAHVLSSVVGKCGALTATVLYNHIGSRTKFWVVY